MKPTSDEEVPKLPRGKGIALSGPMLVRIGMTGVALVAILAFQRPCSQAVGRFVTSFGDGSAAPPQREGQGATEGAKAPAPSAESGANGPPPRDLSQYEVITPSMTEDEVRSAIERAEKRARAAREATPTP